MESGEHHGAEQGLSRRALLGVLAALAVSGGAAALLLSPKKSESFNLGSWPVRSVEITNFTFDPQAGTVTYRSYKE